MVKFSVHKLYMHPHLIDKLTPPELVKIIRHIVKQKAANKLLGEPEDEVLENVFLKLRIKAQVNGVIWDAEESGKVTEVLDGRNG